MLAPPLPGGLRLTSGGAYGAGRFNGPHPGVDFVAGFGTMVLAPAPGIVRRVYWDPIGGRQLAIEHNGFETRYAHLNGVTVRAGDAVDTGEPIAAVGASGMTENYPHLHFELWIGGRHTDPMPYLGAGGSAGAVQVPLVSRTGTAPEARFGELTPMAPPGTYPNEWGSDGGRCDVASGWRAASALETFVRPELTGYCFRADAAGGVAGALAGQALNGLLSPALHIGVVVAAVVLAYGGIKKVLGG